MKKLMNFNFIYLFTYKRFYVFILEKGEGRKKDRERNIGVWLPLACPLLGTWPTTETCALTGNQTSDPLVCRWCPTHWATPVRAKLMNFNFSMGHSFIIAVVQLSHSLLAYIEVREQIHRIKFILIVNKAKAEKINSCGSVEMVYHDSFIHYSNSIFYFVIMRWKLFLEP